jgi:hypothetical protein
MDTKEEKPGQKDCKRKTDSFTGRNASGAGSSGIPSWGTGVTSEPAIVVSTKGKGEPVEGERHLLLVTRTSLLIFHSGPSH